MFEFIWYMVYLFLTCVKRLVSFSVFRPPDPPSYKIEISKVEETNSFYDKLYILKQNKNKESQYCEVSFTYVSYEFLRLNEKDKGTNQKYEKIENIKATTEESNVKDKSFISQCGSSFIPAVKVYPRGQECTTCFIYSHGNSGDIGWCLYDCIDIALHTNSYVVIYEYPGYGMCSGIQTSEEGVYENIRHVYSYVRNEMNIPESNIFIYGHSLGSGGSINIASDLNFKVGGLILQAPFTSCVRTVFDVTSTPFFDFFPNIDRISQVTCPILIFHGSNDSIIPIQHSHELIKQVGEKVPIELFPCENGDHNDLLKHFKSQIYKKIREFMDKNRVVPEESSLTASENPSNNILQSIKNTIEEQDNISRIPRSVTFKDVNIELAHTDGNMLNGFTYGNANINSSNRNIVAPYFEEDQSKSKLGKVNSPVEEKEVRKKKIQSSDKIFSKESKEFEVGNLENHLGTNSNINVTDNNL